MLYLYAIAAALGDIAELHGIQGEGLVTLPFQDALVVAGPVTAAPPIDATALKSQDALVRALHARAAALLPMRFGMTVPDAEALGRSLNARTLDRLIAVRGCEQMIVRVTGATGAKSAGAKGAKGAGAGGAEGAEGAASGTAYLLARAGTHKGSPELAAIAAAAGGLQREVRIEPAQQAGVLGSVYHLIERGRADEYRATIEHAARAIPDVRVIITGPSPAYAFG